MATALSGQKREGRDWLLEAGLESATKRGRAGSEDADVADVEMSAVVEAASSTSITRATIHYAVDCIENGSKEN